MSFLLVKMGCRFLLIFTERSRKSLRTMSAEIFILLVIVQVCFSDVCTAGSLNTAYINTDPLRFWMYVNIKPCTVKPTM